ncbi:MAG: electron transfer flavoprotein subunit beta/FixA family protein [Candidatus Bathyarchaeota archaeon]|nr:MAG: electron transfer flavoprotein subunit beta/FixA family protein [Candidatus Bathyarchaeota archaeon]
MDIIVCVKQVPETAEADLKITADGKTMESAGLVFDINEWDDYALEEAVQIKERLGGTVTAVTVGSEAADSTLRKCLARGADQGIRVTDPKIANSDGYAVAKVLHSAIKDLPFDIVFTGAQAGDDGYSIVGPALAEMLNVPHTTMVKKIQIDGSFAKVNRELEGGLEEVLEVKLPALLSIQTGINEPRYVSIMGIRKAMQKETKILTLSDLALNEKEVGESGSWIQVKRMYIPPVEKQAEFLNGSPEEVAAKIVEILKAQGLI